VAGAGVVSGGTQQALTQMYHNPSVDDGYRVPAPAAFSDFQPPYFPPPNSVPQLSTGASSTVVEFAPGAVCQQPRLFSSSMYGYTPGVQPAMAPAHYPLIPPSSAFDPTDCGGIRATAVGGGEVYGVRSPQRATGGGGEVRVNCGTASTAAVLQATSALPDFANLDNFTFTPVGVNQ